MSRTITAVRSLVATGFGPRLRVRGRRSHDAVFAALFMTALATVWFLTAPTADLAVSQMFHVAGEGFPLSQAPLLKLLRRSSSWTLALALLVALGGLARAAWIGGWSGLGAARRSWCALAGLALGPGLLINLTLKEFWGRPRPVQMVEFGGDAPYVPVWQISDWCRSNCSFASGEGASAAWLAAAVLLLPSPWRDRLMVPTLIYATALSLNRVAFGGHFISDIVLSWSLTALVMSLLHVWMGRRTTSGIQQWGQTVRT
ncbi:phosphatase PAP2 family protein [Brevundimonas sp. FT23042]|uniref:phosphatase PAP2 family protein n=1 Tax=Brevundimonas sp. FT23042 TaxID=3393749 RepID=UPI003B5867AC